DGVDSDADGFWAPGGGRRGNARLPRVPALGDLRWRGTAAGNPGAVVVAAPRGGAPPGEHVRHHRDDGTCDLPHAGAWKHPRRQELDRAFDSGPVGLGDGPVAAAGSGRRARRAPGGWAWPGAGVPAATRSDGGAVCATSVRERWRTVIPLGGSGLLAAG